MTTRTLPPVISLDRERVTRQVRLPGNFMEDTAELRTMLDHTTGRLVVDLTSDVLAQKIPPLTTVRTTYVTIDVPAGWWQHFKLQHAHTHGLRLLARLRPPRMVAITRRVELHGSVERAVLFPYANLVSPDKTVLGDAVPYISTPAWTTVIEP